MSETTTPTIVSLETFRAIVSGWQAAGLCPHFTISARGIDRAETREVEARAWIDDSLSIWTGGFVPHPDHLRTFDGLLYWLSGR